jgi:hypothetical protein
MQFESSSDRERRMVTNLDQSNSSKQNVTHNTPHHTPHTYSLERTMRTITTTKRVDFQNNEPTPRSHRDELAGGSTYESKARPAQNNAKSTSKVVDFDIDCVDNDVVDDDDIIGDGDMMDGDVDPVDVDVGSE